MALEIVTSTAKYANGEKVLTATEGQVIKVTVDDVEQTELTLTIPAGETWTVRSSISGSKQQV